MSEYPSDWEIANLGDLATIKASNVDKKTKEGQKEVSLCNYMDVFKNPIVSNSLKFMRSTASEKEISEFSLSKGDVLLTKDSEVPEEIGIPSVVTENIPDLVCGYHLYMLRANHSRIDPGYLCWTLRSNSSRQYFYQMANGSTRFGLNLRHVEECPVALPPFPEQKKIAEILSGIDRRSNLLSKQIAKEDALFTSFQDQLLESIASTAFAPMHRHDSQLKILPIANLFEVQLGKMLNKEAKEHGHQFQYLGNKNIQQWNPDIRHLELMHFSEDEKRKFSLRSGDLLVCEGGDAGRCCIWEETDAEIYYQKAIHRMRPRSGECTPTFMMHYLAYCKSRNLLSDFISKTSISHLTREKLLEIPIAIPSREEQSSIVEKLESQRKLIAKLFSKSKILKDIKSAVSSDLLSGRKRVTI